MYGYALPRHKQTSGSQRGPTDLAQFDDANDARFVVGVRQLASKRGKQHERRDKNNRSDPAEKRLLSFVVVDRVDHEQHQGWLEDIIVEGVEKLRDHQRQKALLAHKVRGSGHVTSM